MILPLVSIIIPCRNEAPSIRRCLASVLASNYPPDRMEVMVVDGQSTDGTRDMLADFAASDARIRVIDNPARVTPVALNLGISASRGAYILRIDAHSKVDSGYVRDLVGFLESHPEAWGAGGAMQTLVETEGAFAEAITTALSHRFGVGNSGFRTSRRVVPEPVDTVFNCCWRREVFERVGLFHESLARSQDIEMSQRIRQAGGELWRVPSASTTYFARTRLWAYLCHNYSNGVWSLKPALYLGHLPVGWRHLVPLTFVAAILLTCLIALATPNLAALPLIPTLPYLTLNIGASWQAAWNRRSIRHAVFLPIAFAGLHFSYGVGSLWGALGVLAGLLRPQRRSTAPALESTL